MIVWYIHGAGATERSFAWLQHQLPDHEPRFFTYPVSEPVVSAVQRLYRTLSKEGNAVTLLGHSLGGVIATACAGFPWVDRVVSLCAPFGGVKHTELLSMFNLDPLVMDMREFGPMLRSLRASKSTKPHLAVIGRRSLPFLNEPNDGAITVASQTAMPGIRYHEVPLNHFEVLLSEDVAEIVSNFLI